jgi:hypothetical protein
MVARSLLKCAVALVVLWPVSSSAQLFNFDNIDMGAKTVDIGGVSVHVPSPASFCGFDESNPIDAMVLAQIRLMNPNNVPLAIYIDCGELNSRHAAIHVEIPVCGHDAKRPVREFRGAGSGNGGRCMREHER